MSLRTDENAPGTYLETKVEQGVHGPDAQLGDELSVGGVFKEGHAFAQLGRRVCAAVRLAP